MNDAIYSIRQSKETSMNVIDACIPPLAEATEDEALE